MMPWIALAAALWLGNGDPVPAAAPRANTYTITVTQDAPRVASVEVVFHTWDGSLGMAPGAEHLERGWAHFVHDLGVFDANGASVAVEPTEGDGWSASADAAVPVTVRYRVHLEHDQDPWPAGIDAAAYATDWGVFYTGRALFVVADETAPSVVSFVLPDTWEVAAAWDRMAGLAHGFSVPTRELLLQSIVFAGWFDTFSIDRGGFELAFALGGPSVRADGEAYQALAERVFDDYIAWMGDAPRLAPGEETERILVVLNDAGVTDGEVVGNQISIVIDPEGGPMSALIARFVFAHEFFHLWNGHSIRRDGPEDWFSEGFTNYYTFRALYRANVLDETAYFAVLDNLMYQRYAADEATGTMSMRDAVSDKHGHWGLIYGGGLFTAICLDMEIQTRTDGRRTLDDLMRTMFERYGGSEDLYRFNDVVRLASDLSGADQSDFFARYVDGVERIPIDRCLAQAGLDASIEDGHLRVVPRDDATAAELARRASLLGER